MDESGRVPSAPGSREPSPEGLGPSGFDPSRSKNLAEWAGVVAIMVVFVLAWAAWPMPTFVAALVTLSGLLGFLYGVGTQLKRDSDGSPKGGDACGSVHDSAGRRHRPKGQPT